MPAVTPLHAHLADAQRLMDQGLTAAARARLETAVAQDPASATAHLMLGVCLSRLREFEPAAERLRRAIDLGAADAHTLALLGEALRNLGRIDESLEPFRRALAQDDSTLTRLCLAQALQHGKRYTESIAECRAILSPTRTTRIPVSPSDEALVLACVALSQERLGHAEEAVETFRAALRRDPSNPIIATGLCAALNYAAGFSPADILEAHEAYGRIVEGMIGPSRPPMHTFPLGAALNAGESLRVGIVSPDLRRHAVACFLLRLLEHLDRARISLFLYSNSAIEDEVTARFRALAAQFRPVAGQPMSAVARLIAADRVHILIDAAGHTVQSRLPAMALRPAPVQALYLGYPATSGLRAVDWRIVDTLSDPPESDAHSTERLWRLDPCHVAYRPLITPPEPDLTPPSQRPGAPGEITFGSFTALSKLTAEVVPAWASLLNQVPGSRLLIKHERFADAESRADLLARFAAAGAGPGRVTVEEPEPGKAGGLLKHYARIDIALDSFPYSGTTTVCEALSMGVPVVARPGPTTASRTSLPLLAAAGLADLASPTTDAYIHTAAALAHDPARLASLRRDLPGRFASSAACDARSLASRFESALRGMWEHRTHAQS